MHLCEKAVNYRSKSTFIKLGKKHRKTFDFTVLIKGKFGKSKSEVLIYFLAISLVHFCYGQWY